MSESSKPRKPRKPRKIPAYASMLKEITVEEYQRVVFPQSVYRKHKEEIDSFFLWVFTQIGPLMEIDYRSNSRDNLYKENEYCDALASHRAKYGNFSEELIADCNEVPYQREDINNWAFFLYANYCIWCNRFFKKGRKKEVAQRRKKKTKEVAQKWCIL